MLPKKSIDLKEKNSFCVLSQNKKIDCKFSLTSEDLIVIAEHGLWRRSLDGIEWIKNESSLNVQSISNLAEPLLKVIKYYSSRVPFSKIEVSEELICWKFGEADRIYSEWISSELQMNLEKFIGHLPLKVILLFLLLILLF